MEPVEDCDSPNIKPNNLCEISCRICFESESDLNPLITPCKCSGSMKYIHEECLKIWLLSQDKDLSLAECDVCKTKFTMKITLSNKCTCKNYWNECLGLFIFPILFILMISILLVILLFLIQGIQQNTASVGEQTYLILLVIACALIIIIIIVIFIKSVKRACFSAEMVAWKIESQAHNECLEETIEQSNNTLQHEELHVMVIPKISRLNGRNIVRPEIITPRLVPIMRSGELIGYRSKPPTTRSLNASQALGFSQTFPKIEVSASVDGKVVPQTHFKN